jgi:hypothetical protein
VEIEEFERLPIQGPTVLRQVPDALANWHSFREFVDDRYPNGRPLVDKLRAWARPFYSVDDWVLDSAVYTLGMWAIDPTARQYGLCYSPGIFEPPLSFEERIFHLTVASDLPFEPWTIFKRRAECLFKSEMQAFRERVKSLLEGRGLRYEVALNDDHLKWLALYQLEELSPSEILGRVEKLTVTESDVYKTVKKVATAIGLKLRPGRQGRRKRVTKEKTGSRRVR